MTDHSRRSSPALEAVAHAAGAGAWEDEPGKFDAPDDLFRRCNAR